MKLSTYGVGWVYHFNSTRSNWNNISLREEYNGRVGNFLREYLLAILGGTLKQRATQLFVMQKQYVKNVDDFFSKVEREFVPEYLQKRLRK